VAGELESGHLRVGHADARWIQAAVEFGLWFGTRKKRQGDTGAGDLFLPVLDTDFRNGIGHHSAHYEQEPDAIVIFDSKDSERSAGSWAIRSFARRCWICSRRLSSRSVSITTFTSTLMGGSSRLATNARFGGSGETPRAVHGGLNAMAVAEPFGISRPRPQLNCRSTTSRFDLRS
jgi:hypothetical protein